ncbi:MAG: YfhO family protein [Proteobacteria bacterium]|nr:YfhO family protein [Pseudomonadota bacterium]
MGFTSFLQTRQGKYTFSVVALALIVLGCFREYLSYDVIINATDILTQDYFWHVFYREQIFNSPSFVTWLPYINGGTSFYGGLFHIFKPITLLSIILFPPQFAITSSGLIHLFLAGIFTLMYARLIGLGFIASFFAATFFVLSTELVSLFNAGHIGKLNSIAIFPLVLFCVERVFIRRRFFDFILLACALSLQFYEEHIQISFYTCIVVAIYFVWRSISVYRSERDFPAMRKLYLNGVVMVALFFSLSAVSMSKWLEFKAQSERGSGTSYAFATSWSMPPQELLTYVVPQIFGLSRKNYKSPDDIEVFYWGEMPFTQTSDYLGLLPILLTIVACLKCRGRQLYLFLFLTLLFQMLAFGKYTPLYYFFYEYLGFKFFRAPKMLLFVVAFFVSIMAAFGVDWLQRDWGEKKRKFLKKLISTVLIFTLFLVFAVLLADFNKINVIKYFSTALKGTGFSYNPSLVGKRYIFALEGIKITSALIFLYSVVLASRLFTKVRPDVFFALLFSCFILDISILNSKFISAVPMEQNEYFSKDTAVQYFLKNKGMYRVLNSVPNRPDKTVTYIVPNKYILYKIHSATGYEAVQLAGYNEVLQRLNLGSNLIDLLNIRYVVIEKNSVRGRLGDHIGKYKIVVDKDVKILENKNYLPRAFPVHKAIQLKGKTKALDLLSSPRFDPRKTVLLEAPVEVKLSPLPKPETSSYVNISDYKNNEILIDVDMADNGFVVLSEKFYPGWNAYIDGALTQIYKANHIFRAVYLPMGKHKVLFKYEPKSFEISLYITIFSFLFVIFVFAKQWRFLRSHKLNVS